MGAKSFIGTPEMQRIFVLKDKLNCTLKKSMVSMVTVKPILEHGGVHRKVQVGKDQEKAQSEKDSHSKNRGGKKPN